MPRPGKGGCGRSKAKATTITQDSNLMEFWEQAVVVTTVYRGETG